MSSAPALAGQQYRGPSREQAAVRPGTQRETETVLRVPARVCSPGVVTIRLGRLSSGERVGVAFTSPASLAAVFGLDHGWIFLSVRALHRLLAPLAITRVHVDPLPGQRR